MRTARVGSATVALLLSFTALTSCASVSNGVTDGVRRPRASTSEVTVGPLRQPVPFVVKPLLQPVRFPSVGVELDPPPAAYVPPLSAAQALDLFRSDDRINGLERSSTGPPVLQLALITDRQMGTETADGKFVPDLAALPAWIIEFPNVYELGSGPPGHPVRSQRCTFYYVEDAKTGAYKEIFVPCENPVPAGPAHQRLRASKALD